jgi:hypothetical protein
MPGIKKTKEQLAEEINNSPYFTLEGENLESRRETERSKLVVNIFQYYDEPEDFGLELIKCINDCLRYFDPKRELFLPYFYTSFKNKKNMVLLGLETDNPVIKEGELFISRGRKNLLRKIEIWRESFYKIKGKIDTDECIEYIARRLQITPEEVRRHIGESGMLNVQREHLVNEKDGKVVSLVDIFKSNMPSPTDGLEHDFEIKNKFDRIEKALKNIRKDRRQFLCRILTLYLAGDLTRFQRFKEFKKEDYSFIDHELLNQHKDRFSKRTPTQREIAELLGKHEAQVSLALTEFQDTVKKL